MRSLKLLILLLPLACFAAGPEINDSGKVTCESVVIKLNESQIKSANNERIVRLTDVQKKSISPFWTDDSVAIITKNWQDCTCGLIYSVWTKEDEISIPEYFVPRDSSFYNEDSEHYNWPFKLLKKSVIVNDKGEYFTNGKRISIENIRDLSSKEKSIYLNLPPITVVTKEFTQNIIDNFKKYIPNCIPFG